MGGEERVTVHYLDEETPGGDLDRNRDTHMPLRAMGSSSRIQLVIYDKRGWGPADTFEARKHSHTLEREVGSQQGQTCRSIPVNGSECVVSN